MKARESGMPLKNTTRSESFNRRWTEFEEKKPDVAKIPSTKCLTRNRLLALDGSSPELFAVLPSQLGDITAVTVELVVAIFARRHLLNRLPAGHHSKNKRVVATVTGLDPLSPAWVRY